jgi:hypothetical protein
MHLRHAFGLVTVLLLHFAGFSFSACASDCESDLNPAPKAQLMAEMNRTASDSWEAWELTADGRVLFAAVDAAGELSVFEPLRNGAQPVLSQMVTGTDERDVVLAGLGQVARVRIMPVGGEANGVGGDPQMQNLAREVAADLPLLDGESVTSVAPLTVNDVGTLVAIKTNARVVILKVPASQAETH